MTVQEKTCPRCQGPADILHTQQECHDMAGLQEIAPGERYSLAAVAGVIARSNNPLAAAARLRELGFIKDTQ